VVDAQRTSSPTVTLQIDILSNIANCTPFRMENCSNGEMHVPVGSSLTSLTPYVSSTKTGTYQLHKSFARASAAQVVEAGISNDIDPSLGQAKWIKWVGNASGVITVDPKG